MNPARSLGTAEMAALKELFGKTFEGQVLEKLDKIAAALEKKDGGDELREKIRAAARSTVFGNNRDFRSATETLGSLEAVAAQEATMLAELERPRLVRSELLNGQLYQEQRVKLPNGVDISSPASVKAYLDRHVCGQNRATRTLAVAIVDMYYRLHAAADSKTEQVSIQKDNCLFIGPSGVGKTLAGKAAADLIAVPYISTSATALVSSNGNGMTFNNLLREFGKVDIYRDSKGRESKRFGLRTGAEYGVIFIDEIDKLRTRESLQHDMLAFLESGQYRLDEGVVLDTSNLWIMAAGVFEGLKYDVTPTEQDLVKFGFIPELARRFQRYVSFTQLNEDALYNILTNAESSLLSQYKQRLKLRGYELEIEDPALSIIVQYCKRYSAGANGLRTALAHLMEDVLFDPYSIASEKKVIITEKMAQDRLGN